MPGGRQSRASAAERSPEIDLPHVSVCRSRPEKLVFIEAGNTDGWIATDSTVELSP